MTQLATDTNSNAIQVVQPHSAVTVTDGDHAAALRNSVVRLYASTAATYGINAPGSVSLPAGAIEYIKVSQGDIITVTGAVNLALCS